MSKYTFTLQELESVESRENLLQWFKDYDLHDYLSDEEIQVIRERNTWTEDKLANLILDHYYIREIGLETPALFKLKLKTAMREIMEEKAPLIYSASIKIEPLVEFEINEEFKNKSTGNNHNESTGLSVESRTPQGQISKEKILRGDYASLTNANESDGNSTNNTEQDGTKKSSGHNQSSSRLIREYRSNIIMINREIIEDLADLFIGIY